MYQKGSPNTVADSLLQCVPAEVPSAATQLRNDHEKEDIRNAQRSDPAMRAIAKALQNSSAKPKGRKWHRPPLICYRQMWNQLTLVDGICQKYSSGPSNDIIIVPILPHSLQPDALYRSHDVPAAGHQGVEKTLEYLRQQA